MAVNTPLNAISAVSEIHLADKYQRLQSLLRGLPIEVSGSRVIPTSHPLGVSFCMNLLAEKFVDHGEQIVCSKPESAFPIAAVALALWSEFPLFGDLLLAHFYSQCTYLVPFYAARTEDMTDKQYYSLQGYRYDENGKVEPHDKFLKRMTGIATLFFAILSARLPRNSKLTPPDTLSKVWRWLTSLLNLDPRTDITSTVLLECLKISGKLISTVYYRQFNKVFEVLVKQYYPAIVQVSPNPASGPNSRLELFLQSCVKNASIPPPSGELPTSIW